MLRIKKCDLYLNLEAVLTYKDQISSQELANFHRPSRVFYCLFQFKYIVLTLSLDFFVTGNSPVIEQGFRKYCKERSEHVYILKSREETAEERSKGRFEASHTSLNPQV